LFSIKIRRPAVVRRANSFADDTFKGKLTIQLLTPWNFVATIKCDEVSGNRGTEICEKKQAKPYSSLIEMNWRYHGIGRLFKRWDRLRSEKTTGWAMAAAKAKTTNAIASAIRAPRSS